MLSEAKLEVDIDAMREGDIVFANQPIVRVSGPSWQVMMLEAGILNTINAQSLIATKSSRICLAANCDGRQRRVLELGLRRAQEKYGFTPTRASYIGGVDITSNVKAARHYNIPAGGTMAHCFVMREEDEKESFKKYISSFPSKASVLIDTYDTIQGAKNAIQASIESGIPLQSVRLDSGDLAYLSKQVRQVLDDSGFENTKIVVSSDLDEDTIQSLVLEQNAPIDSFGVGTMLVTSYKQPALGGVYKLKQTSNNGVVRDVIKISENPIKTTIPGATQVVRIYDNNMYAGDIICKADDDIIDNNGLKNDLYSINPVTQKIKTFNKGQSAYAPMINVVRNGEVNQSEMNRSLGDIRDYALDNINKLDKSHLRIKSPHIYVSGIEISLYKKQLRMIDDIEEKRNNMINLNNMKTR